MGQGEYQKRLCCGFSFFLGVDAAPAQQEQQHLPDWETKPGSRSKSWAEQKFWDSPSGMVEVLPGCVVILLLLPHQQGGLQKSLQSVCTVIIPHIIYTPNQPAVAYLPQIQLQLPFSDMQKPLHFWN